MARHEQRTLVAIQEKARGPRQSAGDAASAPSRSMAINCVPRRRKSNVVCERIRVGAKTERG